MINMQLKWARDDPQNRSFDVLFAFAFQTRIFIQLFIIKRWHVYKICSLVLSSSVSWEGHQSTNIDMKVEHQMDQRRIWLLILLEA